MRISDRSSDVCSSDLREDLHLRPLRLAGQQEDVRQAGVDHRPRGPHDELDLCRRAWRGADRDEAGADERRGAAAHGPYLCPEIRLHQEQRRSEEHTSELQSLMRISYAVFCLKKKNKTTTTN